MTKRIDSSGVLYKRKSPPTSEMMRRKFFKNQEAFLESCDALRKTFATDAGWWAFLDEEEMRDSYIEVKEWADRVREKGRPV